MIRPFCIIICLGLALLIIASGVGIGVALNRFVLGTRCENYQVLEPPLSGHVPECLP